MICFNNASSIAATLESIHGQTLRISDLVVVDDGSTDRSAAVARAAGARVVSHAANLGRGAARARALSEVCHDVVLGVDATAVLPADFVESVMPWFHEPCVAAVCARIDDPQPQGLIRRWRARHLYRTDATVAVARKASLITTGSLLRRSAVLSVGNFDTGLRHGEDAELGRRLLARGYDVVFDPRVSVISTARNTLCQVLERYWRWNASLGESLSWRAYLKDVAYSIHVMALHDLRARDPAAMPISLAVPHYRAWKTWREGFGRT